MQIDVSTFENYASIEDLIRFQFLNELKGNSLCVEEEITLEISLLDFLTAVSDTVSKADPDGHVEYFHGYRHGCYYMVTRGNDGPRLLVQVSWYCDGDVTSPQKAVFQISVIGITWGVEKTIQLLRERFPERLARVRWWFVTKDQLNYHDVVLQKPYPVEPEYYPFIPEGPMEFMNNYLNHNSSLLFLSGPPGTGKTTLLRNFLFDNQLRAVVTYEDTLFNSDQMFVDFVTSNHHDVMVIEDADIMLSSREHDGNKMISRFLNASDGIIQLNSKKIIFTTNLSSFNDVDEALIRPGRSYGSVLFRTLTPDEATAAARVANIASWTQPDNDVTLAEVFNPPSTNGFGKRSVGFVR